MVAIRDCVLNNPKIVFFTQRIGGENSDSVESQEPLRLKPSREDPEKRGGWGRTPPPTPFFGFLFAIGIMESTTFECTQSEYLKNLKRLP